MFLQVLSKSFKIVPIMIMGKILGSKEYPFYDYVVAGVIALGITLFLVRESRPPNVYSNERVLFVRLLFRSCLRCVDLLSECLLFHLATEEGFSGV